LRCDEFLLIVNEIYKINPLKPRREYINIINDAIERLGHYYNKILKENFTKDDSLHFGFSDNFRFGITAGLLLSNRVLAQDVGIINLALNYKKTLHKGLDAEAVHNIISLFRSFISGLESIRSFVENCQVVYLPHRDIWHYFNDTFGKAYRDLVNSPEYGLLKSALMRSNTRYVPPYMLDGFVASFTLSTSPYSDDKRIIVNLNFLSKISKAISEKLKQNPELLTIYFHRLEAYSKELNLLKKINVANSIDLVTPRVKKTTKEI